MIRWMSVKSGNEHKVEKSLVNSAFLDNHLTLANFTDHMCWKSQVSHEGFKMEFSFLSAFHSFSVPPPQWLRGRLLVFLDILCYLQPSLERSGRLNSHLPGVPRPLSNIPAWAVLECSISSEASLSVDLWTTCGFPTVKGSTWRKPRPKSHCTSVFSLFPFGCSWINEAKTIRNGYKPFHRALYRVD